MPNTENAPSVAIEMAFEPSAAYGPEGGEAERPTWMRIRRTKEQLIDGNPQTRTKERIERRRTEIKHKLGALLLLSSDDVGDWKSGWRLLGGERESERKVCATALLDGVNNNSRYPPNFSLSAKLLVSTSHWRHKNITNLPELRPYEPKFQ